MKKWNNWIWLVLLSTFMSKVYAQDISAYEKQMFVQEGDTLKYRILYPQNFVPSGKYPVILFLHGAGERGKDNEKQLIHGSTLFLSPDFRKSFQAVVIFPQCPRDNYWARVAVDRSELPFRFDFNYKEKPTAPLRMVMQLMDSVRSLDWSRNEQLYVAGLSMGGMGTFEILYRRPDLFAAAVPICGAGDPSLVDSYADKVSVWVFHGAQDNVVLPSYSTEMVIALMKARADVKYTLYREANHNSWDSAFTEPGLLNWIFSKSKGDIK